MCVSDQILENAILDSKYNKHCYIMACLKKEIIKTWLNNEC